MSSEIVEFAQGQVKGLPLKTSKGKEYISFLGIPYAEPPKGKLRFKDPIPSKPWSGIRDATKEGEVAPQIDMFTREFCGDDDCLYLNVHVPQLKGAKSLPVMVNIHGGGFVNGSGNASKFGPEYLIEEDVILVTFNYRLGVIGYLCTDAKNARGDMGLKDQNLAMQWVKNNIVSFNGDPNNITLFGISAGSASVEYHLLSPMSKNLFNRAIMQSGSTLNAWARTRNSVEHAKQLAKVFGYASEGTDGLFEFLNNIETKLLVSASAVLLTDEDLKAGKLFPFTPAINELEGYESFVNGEPDDLLRKGEFTKLPTISGLCEKEGMMIRFFYASEELRKALGSGGFIECVPDYLKKNSDNLDAELRSLYRPRKEDKNPDDCVMDFLSDLSFNAGIFQSLELRLPHNPNDEYFYRFAYDGNLNMIKAILKFKEAGASHGDDTTYLGTSSLISYENATPADYLTISRMVKMWTDFAKSGNPTPKLSDVVDEKWLPLNKDEFRFLDITNDLKMKDVLWPERRQLWEKVYKL